MDGNQSTSAPAVVGMAVVSACARLEGRWRDTLGLPDGHPLCARYAGVLEGAAPSDAGASADLRLRYSILRDAYNYQACLFAPCFPPLPAAAITELSLAARLYIDHLLIADRVIDGELDRLGVVSSSDGWAAQLLSTLKLSEAMGRLTALLRDAGAADDFWAHHDRHFREFAESQRIQAEARLDDALEPGGQSPGPSGQRLGSRLARAAAGKSAMAKCTPAALAAMTGDSAPLPAVYKAIDEVALANQTHDDFRDWEQDLRARRPTAVLSVFIEELGELPRIDDGVPQPVRRAFYACPAVLRLLEEGRGHLETARTSPALRGSGPWQDVQRGFARNYDFVLREMHGLARKVRALPLPADSAHRGAAAGALAFLAREHSVGEWRDFLTTAGESTTWVTAYTAGALSQDQSEGAAGLVDAARSVLHAHRRADGGWGYHPDVATDADSTAAAISVLATVLEPEERSRAVAALLSHQRPDGGFATYRDATEVARYMGVDDSFDFQGWTSSQPCVTGAAAIALLDARAAGVGAVDEARIAEASARALAYLDACRRPGGVWWSYWWNTSLVATALAIRALARASRAPGGEAAGGSAAGPDRERCAALALEGADALIAAQLPGGGWAQEGLPGGRACPFATGLAVQGLAAVADLDVERAAAVGDGIDHLLGSQRPNGSWRASGPIMRLARPDDARNGPEASVSPELGTRIGRSVPDFRHVFTSATVFRALAAAAAAVEAGRLEARPTWAGQLRAAGQGRGE